MDEAINKAFEAYWRHLTRGEDAPAPGDEARKRNALSAFRVGWEEGLLWGHEQREKA